MKVLIIDGENPLAYSVIRVLGTKPDVHITLVSTIKSRIRFSRYCHSFICQQNEGEPDRLNFLKAFADRHKDEKYILLAMSEECIKFINTYETELKEKFIIPSYPRDETLEIIVDKQNFADFLSEHQILIPKTKPLGSRIKERDFSFPVLIKPALGGFAGKGIKKIENYNSLVAEAQSQKRKYLVQEYIQGWDCNFNALASKGEILAYTIQRDISKKRSGFVYSRNIEFVDDERIYGISKEVIRKLDYSGVLNVDMRYNAKDDDFMIIEINPRYWGTIFGSYLSGINFPYLHCLLAQGERLEEKNPPFRRIRFVATPTYFKSIFKRRGGKMKDTYSPLYFHMRDPLPLLVLIGQLFREKALKAIVFIRKKKEKDDRIVVPRG